MLDHDRRIIHSSEESNWRTPPTCFARLDEEFRFHIDAAADRASALCKLWYGPGSTLAFPGGTCEDALAFPWHNYVLLPVPPSREPTLGVAARFFLNPPYSKKHKMPIEPWVKKCWEESQRGCTIVAILPFAPQTDWYRRYVYGHFIPVGAPVGRDYQWAGHAAMEERRLPHRISFLRPDGSPAGNAGVNSVVVIWKPNPGYVGPWQPAVRYWSYR
jgi:hypothetical protein